MSVGIGGGVSLGSATGFLFVDPKGVTRGLNQASVEFERFQRATDKVGRNMVSSLAATNKAAAASLLSDPAIKGQLVAGQRALINEVASATKVFVDQHNIRSAAIKSHAAVMETETKTIKSLQTQQAQAALKTAQATARLNKDLMALSTAQSAGKSNRSIGGFKGFVTQSAKALDSAKAAEVALADAVVDANNRKAASQLRTTKTITESFAEERRAVAKTIDSLKAQTTLRNSLAKKSGIDALAKQAASAEAATVKYIRAMQSQMIVNDQLIANREKLNAEGVRSAAQLDAIAKREEQLLLRRAKLGDITKASYAQVIAADEAFTATTEKNINERIAAMEREKAALLAAQAEQGRLATKNVISTTLNAATKTAFAFGATIAITTSQFAAFEQKMLAVQSITGGTSEELAIATNKMKELAVQLGQSPTTLAEGLYSIAQAGFNLEDSLTIAGVAAKAATAGFTDMETAARPIISVIQAYGLEANSALDVSNKLFESVTAGVFSFSDLASQLGDNVPLAAQLKVSLEELGAAYTVLTRQGNSLSESTTQVNGILRAFLKPTERLQEVLNDAGFATGDAALEQLGLAGALKLATDSANGNNTELTKMFPLIRGLRGVVALASGDYKDYADALDEIANSSEGVGSTQKKLDVQMQATSRKFAIAREEVRQAAIVFGEQFAPSVVKIAQFIGDLANGMSALDPVTQRLVAGFVTWGFAISASVVVFAKMAQLAISVKRTFTELRTAILASRVAMSALAATPLLIILGSIALLTARAIQKHREHKKAIEDLKSAYDSLTESIEQMKLAGADDGNVVAVTKLKTDLIETQATIEDTKKLYQGLIDTLQTKIDVLGTGADEYIVLAEQLKTLKDRYSELEDVEKTFAKATNIINDSLAQPNVNIPELVAKFQDLNLQLEQGTLTLPEYAAAVENVRANISDYVDETKLAKDGTEDFGDGLDDITEKFTIVAEFFKSAIGDTEDFRSAVADLIGTVRESVGITAPVDDPFGFIKAEKNLKSSNIFELLLDLSKLRETDLTNFTPDIKKALELQEALAKVEANLIAVSDAVSQNESDISLWQSRIDLIDNTLGTTEDGFANLNKLVAENKLTQQQADDVLEDAIWLRERSAGGILDEQAAQALLISSLRDYVEQHDSLDGSYKQLDADTQNRINALKSENVQMALNTAIMLKMLETMGLIPEGVSTKFIADISAFDPVVGALFEDFGITSGKTNEVRVQTKWDDRSAVSSELADIDSQISELNKAKVGIRMTIGMNGTDDQAVFTKLSDINDQIDALNARRAAIQLAVDTGTSPSDIDELISLVDDFYISTSGKGRNVITVESAEAADRLREITGITIADKRFKIVVDGLATENEIKKELSRRLNKTAAKLGLQSPEGGFARAWKLVLESDTASAEEKLAVVREAIQVITGDADAVKIGVDTKAAQTAILALSDNIDATLLTPEFIAYLDANNDGALDETELAQYAVDGFRGTYKAYLITNAEETKADLFEVDGVKTEVLKDGTLKITADSQEALDKFSDLNADKLDDKELKVSVVLDDPGGAFGDGTGGPDTDISPVKKKVTTESSTVTTVETKYKSSGDTEATAAAENVKAAVEEIPANKTTTITVEATTAESTLNRIKGILTNWPSNVSSSFSFSEGENKGVVEALSTTLDTMDTSTYSPTIDVEITNSDTVIKVAENLANLGGTKSAKFEFSAGDSLSAVSSAVVSLDSLSTQLILTKADAESFATSVQNSSTESAISVAAGSSSIADSVAQMTVLFSVLATSASTQGANTGDYFAQGVAGGMSNAENEASEGASNILAALDVADDSYNVGYNIGFDLGYGIKDGINSVIGDIAAAAAAAVTTAETAARAAAQSNSPSKLFRKLGQDLMKGQVLGIKDGESSVRSAMMGAMNTTIGKFASARDMSGATSIKGGNPVTFATQPTSNSSVYNVAMDVTVPSANFKEWIDTMGFVQNLRRSVGPSLAGSRGR